MEHSEKIINLNSISSSDNSTLKQNFTVNKGFTIYRNKGVNINAEYFNFNESLVDNSNKNNNNNNTNLDIINNEKEDDIIIMIKNDIENYVTYLNEHEIYSLKDLLNNDKSSEINNEYDWSMTEELIIKEKNDLEEINGF